MLISVVQRGDGFTSQETLTHCPLWSINNGGWCSVAPLKCRFGLTEITVPRLCPLRNGPVERTVTINSNERNP